ncbi:hypothetical protein NQL31_003588 [Lotmaria passim]
MWTRQLKTCPTTLRCGRPCAGAVCRLCAPPLATSFAALLPACRAFSTEEVVDEEVQWTRAMTNKYGPGNYQLFRPLYKDLCDEIRREYYTKPPPPPTVTAARRERHDGSDGGGGGNSVDESATQVVEGVDDALEKPLSSASSGADGHHAASEHVDPSTPSSTTPPEPTYGDGTWTVQYHPEHNVVSFHRDAVKEGRLGEINAWSRIELKDPPRLNAVLTFADWIPIEIVVERNGVLIHFSMASNEGGMHMRNVRVYEPASAEERAALLNPSEDGEQARKKFYYDGPCLWHLELDFQNELYDVMQDHGISLDWVHWAASWVFYLEHVNYVKWNLGLLEELIPSPLRGPESDFLSAAERALLEEPVEDWLEAHSL